MIVEISKLKLAVAQTHLCIRLVRIIWVNRIGVERGLAASRVERSGSWPRKSKGELGVNVSLEPCCFIALVVHSTYEANQHSNHGRNFDCNKP